MKLIILFIGLFCLLFFNQGGIRNTAKYRNFAVADETCQIVSDNTGSLWNYEKNESNPFELPNKKLSQGKKRFGFSDRDSSDHQTKIYKKLSGFLPILNSKSNLFLIFHYSQSLWQVFLQ